MFCEVTSKSSCAAPAYILSLNEQWAFIGWDTGCNCRVVTFSSDGSEFVLISCDQIYQHGMQRCQWTDAESL